MPDRVFEAPRELAPNALGDEASVGRIHIRIKGKRPEEQLPMRIDQDEQALPIELVTAGADQMSHV